MLRLPRFTNQSAGSYAWLACLIGIIPIIVSGEINSLMRWVAANWIVELPMPRSLGLFLVISWLETLLMWPLLWILKQIFQKRLWVATVFGALWSALHALVFPYQSGRIVLGL
jgi:hypothetical protein